MSSELIGKSLAECKNYHFSPVKANINGKKYITLNTEKGNRETAVNIYLSRKLSRLYDVDQLVNPHKATIGSYVDEETGETVPWLQSTSSYVSYDELMAMFS